jgi:protein-disulfide isomerase
MSEPARATGRLHAFRKSTWKLARRATKLAQPMRTLLSLSIVAWLVAGWVPAARAGFDPDATYRVPADGAPTSGDAEAPVTIVEFSDYACGYCIRARATVAALALLYPGQLRWVHRSVPFISGTTLGAEAAHAAAAQGQFEAMEAELYALGGHYDRVTVEMLAQGLGLDMLRFRAELDAGAARSAIGEDVALARRLGVTATPTFFINGRPILGNQALAVFVKVIDEELARAVALPRDPAGGSRYDRLVAQGRAAADEGPRVSAPRLELSSLQPYRVGTGLPGVQQGPAAAPVTLVVFSDFECPFCARNQAAIVNARRVFGDSLRLIFRHLPLPFHRRAQLAAEAAMAAAAQGKFWSFHDHLFEAPGALARADLEQLARTLGLDLERFRAELDAHLYRDAVRLDAAGGAALGVDGTPTMFLNGMLLSGAKSPADLAEAISLQLELAKQVVAAGVAPQDVYAVRMAMALGHERSDPATVPLARGAQSLQAPPLERLQTITASCRRRAPADPALAPLPEPLAGFARRICAAYAVTR